MDLRLRFFFLMLIAAVLCGTAYHVTRQLQPDPPTRESLGLDWLRKEYQLSDAAFAQVTQLHRSYFARCDAMCARMIEAHRPSSLRRRLGKDQIQADENRQREKVICESCLDTMIHHLRAVASLMEPDQGRRFLDDILPEVTHPPELEALRSQTSGPVQ